MRIQPHSEDMVVDNTQKNIELVLDETGAKKFVVPGEVIGTTEEFVVGEGAYEDGGKILATASGFVGIDQKDKKINVVKGVEGPLMLKNGDMVIGVIDMIRSSMAIVNVVKVPGKARVITGETEATLHVSEISKGYVDEIAGELHIQDIIKAKVYQTKPSVQITLKGGDDLGIIHSVCSRCKTTLKAKDGALECPTCKYTDKRKVSSEYGQGKI